MFYFIVGSTIIVILVFILYNINNNSNYNLVNNNKHNQKIIDNQEVVIFLQINFGQISSLRDEMATNKCLRRQKISPVHRHLSSGFR
jgi:hypothetical protein